MEKQSAVIVKTPAINPASAELLAQIAGLVSLKENEPVADILTALSDTAAEVSKTGDGLEMILIRRNGQSGPILRPVVPFIQQVTEEPTLMDVMGEPEQPRKPVTITGRLELPAIKTSDVDFRQYLTRCNIRNASIIPSAIRVTINYRRADIRRSMKQSLAEQRDEYAKNRAIYDNICKNILTRGNYLPSCMRAAMVVYSEMYPDLVDVVMRVLRDARYVAFVELPKPLQYLMNKLSGDPRKYIGVKGRDLFAETIIVLDACYDDGRTDGPSVLTPRLEAWTSAHPIPKPGSTRTT